MGHGFGIPQLRGLRPCFDHIFCSSFVFFHASSSFCFSLQQGLQSCSSPPSCLLQPPLILLSLHCSRRQRVGAMAMAGLGPGVASGSVRARPPQRGESSNRPPSRERVLHFEVTRSGQSENCSVTSFSSELSEARGENCVFLGMVATCM